ncbi:MAG: CCA tRNA nucleotidyltransferase [Cyanobacteriota bacterium]
MAAAPTPPSLPGIPPDLIEQLVRAAADDRLALVGGAVRDWLLHRVHNDPWRGVPDLDLVVEPAIEPRSLPAAHRLARTLRQILGSELLGYYQEHAAYGTVELELRLTAGPLLLDVASARRETYPTPGENPEVSFGRLDDDLARRDFTINAMALLLDGSARGQLLDPHGGQVDLKQRQLRFLHPHSVRDDPTRIVRGARYAARLGFGLAPEALEQLRSTLASWPWAWSPGDPPGQVPRALGTRLRMELDLLLEREDWLQGLAALQDWGALTLLDAQLQNDRHWHWRLRRAARLGLPPLAAFLAGAADPLALAERLQLPLRQQRLLAGFLGLRQRLEGQGAEAAAWNAARWSSLLEEPGCTPAMVALALATGAGPRRPLLRWWLRWRHLDAGTDAVALMAAEGWKPGPQLGARLRALRRDRLTGERL